MKNRPLPIRPVLTAIGLSFFTPASAQITTDGQLDAAYGPPRAVQLAPTGFGDQPPYLPLSDPFNGALKRPTSKANS